MDKFASLFVFYATGCIVSLIILVMENIIINSKNQDPNISSDLTADAKLRKAAIEKIVQQLEMFENDKNINLILVQMHKLLENM